MISSVTSSIDFRSITMKIHEVIEHIEVKWDLGGSRCNEENIKLEIKKILWDEVWCKLGVERPDL